MKLKLLFFILCILKMPDNKTVEWKDASYLASEQLLPIRSLNHRHPCFCDGRSKYYVLKEKYCQKYRFYKST